MFSSWAAAVFVGGPAATVFLYTSKLDILLQLYNAYANRQADKQWAWSLQNYKYVPWSGVKWAKIPVYIAVVNAVIGGALVMPIMSQFKPAAAEDVVYETPVDETTGYY